MRSTPSVSTLLVQPLVRALASHPPALDELLLAADLTPELLADPAARVSPAQFRAAWGEGVRLSRDRRLALAVAASLPSGALGIVEYVCRSAATVGDALAQWVRYLNRVRIHWDDRRGERFRALERLTG